MSAEKRYKKEHLPMYGAGPFYVSIISVSTILAVVLSKMDIIPIYTLNGLDIPFRILGGAIFIGGGYLWYAAVFKAKIDEGILHNKLVTTGIYSYVRNPIYSAFLFLCTGVLLMYGNMYLLIMPVFYWLLLGIILKYTEEKWLHNQYSREYDEYCAKVNRVIPWKKR